MIYHYKCNDCGKIKDENFPMGSAVKEIICDCGGKAVQDILGKRVQSHLSEDYIATSEFHSRDYGDDDTIERQMEYLKQ